MKISDERCPQSTARSIRTLQELINSVTQNEQQRSYYYYYFAF